MAIDDNGRQTLDLLLRTLRKEAMEHPESLGLATQLGSGVITSDFERYGLDPTNGEGMRYAVGGVLSFSTLLTTLGFPYPFVRRAVLVQIMMMMTHADLSEVSEP